ncbi:VAN3-binding protein [Ziziphus jujuba]|uniref:VAN3-binding protein n=1 Tax=Ziziphus jujuba TaxID=326968 RepID=A0ABM3ZY31_ZIZJJ|nr:VAN3-binding protein [Ziziphus jujuba]
MDSSFNPTAPSEAHPETMDFLSRAWCNFAVQALQPELQDQSMVVLDNQLNNFESNTKIATTPYLKLDKSVKVEDPDVKLPQWKSNDVKSWIWMQQAMHPELNYSGYFRKKWMSWKLVPFKSISIRKWLKEIKQRRKEGDRLQRAEVHAAISVAGVAAALAAIAVDNAKKEESSTAKGAAVASAAALVAAQCAKVAEAMGAKREQLSTVMGSAMSGTTASDVLTLTAAAKTSLKGAATLKARTGGKNRLKGIAPVLPIEDSSYEMDLDLEKYRSTLAKGAELGIETPDGDYLVRSVSIVLSSEAKPLLQIRKLNLLKTKKESVILELHAELYKDSEGDEEDSETCYMIVLTTSRGIFKLDMGDDYQRYKAWATTINHLLMLSSSITKYQLHFCKN